VRTGLNPLAGTNAAAYHWFSGDGMVHGIRLQDGKAEWYRTCDPQQNSSNDAAGTLITKQV